MARPNPKTPITTPPIIGSQPATDYAIDRIIIDYNKDELIVDLVHLSAEGKRLLHQTIRKPLDDTFQNALLTRVTVLLRDLGAVN